MQNVALSLSRQKTTARPSQRKRVQSHATKPEPTIKAFLPTVHNLYTPLVLLGASKLKAQPVRKGTGTGCLCELRVAEDAAVGRGAACTVEETVRAR